MAGDAFSVVPVADFSGDSQADIVAIRQEDGAVGLKRMISNRLASAIWKFSAISVILFGCLLAPRTRALADYPPPIATAPRSIVSIVFDDADYYDFGFINQAFDEPDIQTPVIDLLRAGGKLMTQYLCSAPICSPTRVAWMTGNFPVRHGALDPWSTKLRYERRFPTAGGLPNNIPLLGTMMQATGRRTGHFGKWHVGYHRPQYRPDALGFDEFSTHIDGPKDSRSGIHQFATQDGFEEIDVDFLDWHYSDQVIDFIEDADDNGQDFFVNYWPLSPHIPLSVPRNFDNSETGFDLQSDRGRLAAMMYAVDQSIGDIVDVLIERDLFESTLILISSDNGGLRGLQHLEVPHRGFKATLFEGGIHVPLVAHWPGGITAGTSNPSVVATHDMLPTILDLCGEDVAILEDEIDGRSKASVLTSDSILDHDPILWETAPTKRSSDPRSDRHFAIRDGNLKLIKVRRLNDATNPNAYALYDVVADPDERQKLNETHPVEFEVMKMQLHWLRQQSSQFGRFPTQALEQAAPIEFDPTIDIATSDMVLTFDLQIPDATQSSSKIFNLPSSQQCFLASDRTLRWRLLGHRADGQAISTVLRSGPLAPGIRRITLRIDGFRYDYLKASLLVDDSLEAELPSTVEAQWYALRPVSGNGSIGAPGQQLTNIQFHRNFYYLDELP